MRLGAEAAQLGGVGGVAARNCKLLLVHVVLGNERCGQCTCRLDTLCKEQPAG